MQRLLKKRLILPIGFISLMIFVETNTPDSAYAKKIPVKRNSFVVADVKTDADQERDASLRQKIIIGGTGDSQILLRKLAQAFEKRFANVAVEVPESIGSSGGIKAVLKGLIDLARMARPLSETEKEQGLNYKLFAYSPVVFVVHPSVEQIDNLNVSEIIGIYSGKITDWEQVGGNKGRIYAIKREKGDSSTKILNEKLPGFKDIPEIAGMTTYTTPETVEAISNHENTIGFLPLCMTIGTKLKVLKIDNVSPSTDNVKSGKYGLAVPLGLAFKGELNEVSRDFVNFLYSLEAKDIITNYFTVPVKEDAGQ